MLSFFNVVRRFTHTVRRIFDGDRSFPWHFDAVSVSVPIESETLKVSQPIDAETFFAHGA